MFHALVNSESKINRELDLVLTEDQTRPLLGLSLYISPKALKSL